MIVRGKVPNGHEVLLISADKDGVVIDCVFVAGHAPGQLAARDASIHVQTVVDAALNLSALFIVIPSHQLQHRQLV